MFHVDHHDSPGAPRRTRMGSRTALAEDGNMIFGAEQNEENEVMKSTI